LHSIGFNAPLLFRRDRFIDERGEFHNLLGIFLESLNVKPGQLKQINYSKTHKIGTVRGMHFQAAPKNEIKIVNCLAGKIHDVCVNVDRESSQYLKIYEYEIDAKKDDTLIIPGGFAHGFQSLSSNVEILYLHTSPYSKNSETGLNPLDPSLGIEWPLAISIISKKDKNFEYLDQARRAKFEL